MFVLTLMGVTLLTLGGHFTQTARYAQMARLETQAAQILHSGLAWAKLHHADFASDTPPSSLDAQSLVGPGVEVVASWTPNIDAKGWQLTVTLTQGRHKFTRTAIFHPASPESNLSDSR